MAGLRTPQAKLASWPWKLLHSWWVLAPLVSLGLLCWLGFLVAGILTGRAKYWVSFVLYLVNVIVLFIFVSAESGWQAAVGTAALLIGWLGASLQAGIMNYWYLREVAWRGSPPSAGPRATVRPAGTAPFHGAPVPAQPGPPPGPFEAQVLPVHPDWAEEQDWRPYNPPQGPAPKRPPWQH